MAEISTDPPTNADRRDAPTSAAEVPDEGEHSQVARGMDRCPACEYSLVALPLDHQCPECGFEYDRHTRVWRVGREDFGLSRLGRTALVGAFGTLACLYGLKWLRDLARGPGVAGSTNPMMAAIFVAGLTCLGCWRNEHPRLIAVGPEGVTFRRWPRRAFTLTWTDLADVSPKAVVERPFFRAATSLAEAQLSRHMRAMLRKPTQRNEVYETMRRARARARVVGPRLDCAPGGS